MRVRPARASEAAVLSQLALDSKGVWGYEAAFLERCRQELAVTPADIGRLVVEVAEPDAGGAPLGFYVLDAADPGARLVKLCVAAGWVRRGIGRALWEAALQRAVLAGAESLTWDADPHAVPFYRRMGAVQVGWAPSGSIPGRQLPLMRITLPHPTGQEASSS